MKTDYPVHIAHLLCHSTGSIYHSHYCNQVPGAGNTWRTKERIYDWIKALHSIEANTFLLTSLPRAIWRRKTDLSIHTVKLGFLILYLAENRGVTQEFSHLSCFGWWFISPAVRDGLQLKTPEHIHHYQHNWVAFLCMDCFEQRLAICEGFIARFIIVCAGGRPCSSLLCYLLFEQQNRPIMMSQANRLFQEYFWWCTDCTGRIL